MSVEGLGCLFGRFFRGCIEGEMVPPIPDSFLFVAAWPRSDRDVS